MITTVDIPALVSEAQYGEHSTYEGAGLFVPEEPDWPSWSRIVAGQSLVGGTYRRYRNLVDFDTTVLPVGCRVTEAILELTVKTLPIGSAFDIQVRWVNDETGWGFERAILEPLEGVICNTAELTEVGQKVTISVDPAGIYIDGSTVNGWAIVSALDAAEEPPTGDDEVEFYTARDTADVKPKLTVTYQTGRRRGFNVFNRAAGLCAD